jgi:hypothetical protein
VTTSAAPSWSACSAVATFSRPFGSDRSFQTDGRETCPSR